jgi:hypothetical protein
MGLLFSVNSSPRSVSGLLTMTMMSENASEYVVTARIRHQAPSHGINLGYIAQVDRVSWFAQYQVKEGGWIHSDAETRE